MEIIFFLYGINEDNFYIKVLAIDFSFEMVKMLKKKNTKFQGAY
jgi:hypothetical protein